MLANCHDAESIPAAIWRAMFGFPMSDSPFVVVVVASTGFFSGITITAVNIG